MKPKKLFVAAIVRANAPLISTNIVESSRYPDGDWSCIIGSTQESVITRALRTRARWQEKSGKTYNIYTGILGFSVETPVPTPEWTLVKL